MRILALDAALARCAAAVVIDQQLISVRQENAVIGHAALLPVMTEALSLYQRAGFERTEAYSQNPTSGAIYMKRELVKPPL